MQNPAPLLAALMLLSACAAQPVAVPCPPFPTPPQSLMKPPPTTFLLPQNWQSSALKPHSN